MFRITAGLWVALLAVGCQAPPVQCGAGTRLQGQVCVVDGPDAGPDAGPTLPPDAGPGPLEAEADCARVLGGPPVAQPAALAISGAHAAVRFFGPANSYTAVDNALSQALDAHPALEAEALVAYSAALPGVCAVAAHPEALPAASVQMQGAVAVIHPGTGAVSVPPSAAAVAIDLTGLFEAEGLPEALQVAVAEALSAPLPRSTRQVRQHVGYTDQNGDGSAYSNQLAPQPQADWPAHATGSRPLAVIVGPSLAPSSAELAGTLRLANRAFLWGASVLAATAESRWQPGVGQVGLAYRDSNLMYGGTRWPDEVPADVDAVGVAAALQALPSAGAPPSVVAAVAGRPALTPIDLDAAALRVDLTPGTARAALLTIHGALKRFFPYFSVVGDHTDDRLQEVLGSLEAGTLDRRLYFNLASRLGEAIHDGHNFLYDISGQVTWAGYFAVRVDQVDGQPVIAQSLAVGVNAGDTIVSIDGVPTADWYAAELPRTAGATPGYRFDLATRKYLELSRPTPFGLRAPDGTVRTVTAMPAPVEMVAAVYAKGERLSGRLTDKGAGDLQYLNLSDSALTATHTCLEAITQAQGAAGLVIDMRGYPGAEAFACLSNLASTRMFSPLFHTPVLTGPAVPMAWQQNQWSLDPTQPSYTGPAVLLVGPTTVSAAETISTMLFDAHRLKKVVGRQSAGTNGNITAMLLPGGLYFTFTGLQVLHLDGSTFDGQGLLPDIVVAPTVDDLATGADRALDAAIAALRAP